MEQTTPLLDRIERYLQDNDISPATFGKRALNDPCLVSDLRLGRELRRATANRVEQFMYSEATS